MIETLNALAEPNRLAIVELLRGGQRPVGSIAHELALKQPLVSRHLKVLSDAGIVAARVDAQRRIYRLEAEPFHEISAWLDRFAGLWEARFNRLDAHLAKEEQ